MVCNGDRTERSPIQSVVIPVIDKKTNQSEHKAGKCLALIIRGKSQKLVTAILVVLVLDWV